MVLKIILSVGVHEGSKADSTAYGDQYDKIKDHKVRGTFWLGDHAYLSDFDVLPPYTKHEEMKASMNQRQGMKLYAKSHSSERVCSEHGNGKLKQWAIIRGRSDISLFSSGERFTSVVNVCWGLTNFLTLHTK